MNFKQFIMHTEQFEDILDNNLPEGYNLIENLTESIRYSIKLRQRLGLFLYYQFVIC